MSERGALLVVGGVVLVGLTVSVLAVIVVVEVVSAVADVAVRLIGGSL